MSAAAVRAPRPAASPARRRPGTGSLAHGRAPAAHRRPAAARARAPGAVRAARRCAAHGRPRRPAVPAHLARGGLLPAARPDARSAVLADREQALEQEIAVAGVAAAAGRAGRARSAWCAARTRRSSALSDGRILGKPKAGRRPAAAHPGGRRRRPEPTKAPSAGSTDRSGDARSSTAGSPAGDTDRHDPPPAPAAAGAGAGRRHVAPHRPARPPARRPARATDAAPPRPAGAAAPRRRHRRRLRGAIVVLALVLSLFGARLVQLQGLDATAYAAEAAGPAAHRRTARDPRHHHRPQRGGPRHHRRRGEHHRRPDARRGPGRDRRAAWPRCWTSTPPLLQERADRRPTGSPTSPRR